MAVLPTYNGLPTEITIERQPSQTWYINQTTNRIQGEIDGLSAVAQAVEIILNIERFRWQIFKPSSGMQWRGLIGNDPGYVASEMRRRIQEALLMDDRINGISDFSYAFSGNILSVSLTVQTVYGEVSAQTEVTIS